MAVNGRRKRDTAACIDNVESKKACEDYLTLRNEHVLTLQNSENKGVFGRVGVGVVKTRH